MTTLKHLINLAQRLFTVKRRSVQLLWVGAGITLLVLICSIAAIYVLPFDDARLRKLDVSTVVSDRDGGFLRAYLSQDQRWRIPAKLDKLSPWIVKATLAAEDKRFFHHSGIDLIAVGRATVANIKSGRIVSGASTISMQVAGFAIDSRERSLTRKFRQAWVALQLEANWTKEEILECYLTHASYGGNVCGVEAASRRYFNKTANELSSGEAALLAGIPQSPERFRPDRHLQAARKRRNYVLGRLFELGDLSKSDFERVSHIKIDTGTYEVPVNAPHICDIVRTMFPAEPEIKTTIQAGLQREAETVLAESVRKQRGAGITNGSIVILDNSSGEILAMVGSVDYWNMYDRGEVNGALGFRSPGSTLKPLIYGEAMDAGLLEPDEMLYDVPVTISGYSPVNYDRQFRGPVTASKALAWSLNIPAIEIMRRVGVNEFRDCLRHIGIPVKVNPVGDQGLSFAIGTCSVRLLDLCKVYSSLASEGQIKPIVWVKGKSSTRMPLRKWLSPESSAIILAMLSDNSVRAPEDVDLQLAGLQGIAWKTGTSNGFRDAWTVAVTDRYTIGVWMGNMNGQPSRALVGGKVAAPVALGLAKSLNARTPVNNKFLAKSIVMESACLQTGLRAGPYCSEKSRARFLKSGTDTRICNVHQHLEVDALSGYVVCSRCKINSSARSQTFSLYPAEVATWMRASGHQWGESLPPAHNPDCQLSTYGEPPVIVTPTPGAEIVLLEDIPGDFQKITLSARSDDPGAQLFWFVDGSLVGSAPAYDAIQITSTEGRHKIKCFDSRGRVCEAGFTVVKSGMLEKVAAGH